MFKSIAVGGAIVASLLFGTTLANGQIYVPTYNYALVIKMSGEVCFGVPQFNGEVAPANATPSSPAYLVERRGISSDDFIKDCADDTGRDPKSLSLVLIKENSQPTRIAVVDNEDLKNNGTITPICIVFEVTENICTFINSDGGERVPVTAKKKGKKGKTERAKVTYCETWRVICGSRMSGDFKLEVAVEDEGQMCLTQEETLSVPLEEVALLPVSGISLLAARVSGKIVLCCHANSSQPDILNDIESEGRIYCLDFDSKGNNPLAIDGVDMALVNAAK